MSGSIPGDHATGLALSYLTILVMKLRGLRSSEMGMRTLRMHNFGKHASICQHAREAISKRRCVRNV